MKSKEIEINLYQDNDKYRVLKYEDKEQWRKDRIKAIGGSDVSCIVGMNPYKESYQLWEEKMGIKEAPDISNRWVVQYGTEAEEYLRELFKLDFHDKYEVQYLADCTLEDNEYPFMHYSPDGLLIEKETGRKGVWENKTTNIVQSSQKEKWNDSIPNNYYTQILFGLIVTGFDFVVLKAQLKFENKDGLPTLSTRHYYFDANDEQVKQDMEYLQRECVKWWNTYILGNKKPPLELKL